jgi:lipoprotein signal peptidase
VPTAAALLAWSLLKPLARRDRLSLKLGIVVAVALVALDQGSKLLLEAALGWERVIPVIPNAFRLRLSPNHHGSYIASLLDVSVPTWIYLVVYPLLAWLGFSLMGFYQSRNGRTGWLALARVFFAAGLIAATADRLFWRFTLDWIVVGDMFAFDLKDLFVNLAILCGLSDPLANPNPVKLSHGIRDDIKMTVEFLKYAVGKRDGDAGTSQSEQTGETDDPDPAQG